jgi:hypothetical protein
MRRTRLPATRPCYRLPRAGAIGAYVRRCLPPDPTMAGSNMQIILTVTTDSDGVVRRAIISPIDAARASADPVLQQFTERAVSAVMDPNCSHLPLPQALLGHDGSSPSGSRRDLPATASVRRVLVGAWRSLLSASSCRCKRRIHRISEVIEEHGNRPRRPLATIFGNCLCATTSVRSTFGKNIWI